MCSGICLVLLGCDTGKEYRAASENAKLASARLALSIVDSLVKQSFEDKTWGSLVTEKEVKQPGPEVMRNLRELKDDVAFSGLDDHCSLNEEGEVLDPWDNPIVFYMDHDHDGLLILPSGERLVRQYFLYSCGPNGVDEFGQGDDIQPPSPFEGKEVFILPAQ